MARDNQIYYASSILLRLPNQRHDFSLSAPEPGQSQPTEPWIQSSTTSRHPQTRSALSSWIKTAYHRSSITNIQHAASKSHREAEYRLKHLVVDQQNQYKTENKTTVAIMKNATTFWETYNRRWRCWESHSSQNHKPEKPLVNDPTLPRVRARPPSKGCEAENGEDVTKPWKMRRPDKSFKDIADRKHNMYWFILNLYNFH